MTEAITAIERQEKLVRKIAIRGKEKVDSRTRIGL
jgi:hypothetical protein